MSFDAREIATATGQPIRLYLFVRGTVRSAYCTADRDVTYQSQLYKSTAINDNGVRQSGDAKADSFEITAPADLTVAQLYRGTGPSGPITITVYDIHYSESDVLISYIGSIYSVKFPAEDRCTLVCSTEAAGLSATGLRLTWARGCPYTWGDVNCTVNRDTYRLLTTVETIDDQKITSAACAGYADNWFSGGVVQWLVSPGQYDSRGIESHTSSELVLLGGTDGLVLNNDIQIFPGCDRTIQTCHDKFSNHENYGGCPNQPGISPFDGNPIF